MKDVVLDEINKYYIPENKYQEFKTQLNKIEDYFTLDELNILNSCSNIF